MTKVKAKVTKVIPNNLNTTLPKIDESGENSDENEVIVEGTKHERYLAKKVKKANYKVLNQKKRRLTAAQLAFRGKFLGSDTPEVHIRKHMIEKWTHSFLVSQLIVVALFALINVTICIFAWNEGVKEEKLRQDYKSVSFDTSLYDEIVLEKDISDGDSVVATKVILTGTALQLVASLFGALGATRVIDDLKHDHDGLGTPGQDMLQTYFYVSLLFILLIIPYCGALLYDAQVIIGVDVNSNSGSYLKVASMLCLFSAFLITISLIPTLMIVTVYKLSHSFLETFALLLSSLSAVAVYLTLKFMDYTYGMRMIATSTSHYLHVGVICFLALCFTHMMSSFLGFFAGFTENKVALLLYSILMLIVVMSLLFATLGLALIPFDDIIRIRCLDILKTTSYVWWYSTIECQKYGGTEIGALVEAESESRGFFFATANIGSNVRCADPEQSVSAWEYNSVNASNDFRGCLNTQCCDLLINNLEAIKIPLLLGLIAFTTGIVITVSAALWLRRNVALTKEKVLISSWKTLVALLSVLSIVTVVSSLFVIRYLNAENYVVDQTYIVNRSGVIIDDFDIISSFPSFCNNNVKDGLETDVDCGRTCNRCGLGKICLDGTDCSSGYCRNNICSLSLVNSCNNSIRDFGEVDVDCGWVACQSKCGTGKQCHSNNDCDSKHCSNLTCISCSDNVTNGQESDVDCGSINCILEYLEENVTDYRQHALCSDGKACIRHENCASGRCFQKACVSCTNGILDGSETSVDCGGNCNYKCSLGDSCLTDTDCSSEKCSNGVCILSSEVLDEICFVSNETLLDRNCSDNQLSFLETDIDCGGYFCNKLHKYCQDGQNCSISLDCTSGSCSGNKCVSCSNMIHDGDETDTDCGGSCDRKCQTSQNCITSNDCDINLVCFSENLQLLATEIEHQIFVSYTNKSIYNSTNSTCVLPVTSLQLERESSFYLFEEEYVNIFLELFTLSTTTNESIRFWNFPCKANLLISVEAEFVEISSTSHSSDLLVTPFKDKGVLAIQPGTDLSDVLLKLRCAEFPSPGQVRIELEMSDLCQISIFGSANNLRSSISLVPHETRISFQVKQLVDPSCQDVENCAKVPLEGVRIRMASVVNETCMNREDDLFLPGNCTLDCSIFTTQAECQAYNECCETIVKAPCLNEDFEADAVIAISDAAGRVDISFVETNSLSRQFLYPINIQLSATYFIVQDLFVVVDPGTTILLPEDVVLAKSETSIVPCKCSSFANDVVDLSASYFCRLPFAFICFDIPDSGSCVDLDAELLLCSTNLTFSPTSSPSNSPTVGPTKSVTVSPTKLPTMSPVDPTSGPTASPTNYPSSSPTFSGDTRCASLVDYFTDDECEKLGCPEQFCQVEPIGIANETSTCTGEWIEVFRQVSCQVQVDIGQTAFDTLFKNSIFFRYDIGATPYLFMKILSHVVASDYQALLHNFQSRASFLSTNFDLFSNELDMYQNKNSWKNCPTGISSDIGFPGECGPDTTIPSKWCKGYCQNSLPSTRGVSDFSFHICSESNQFFSQEEVNPNTGINFTFNGNIVDAETGTGLLSRLYLYSGTVTRRSYRFRLPTLIADMSLTFSTGNPTLVDPLLQSCGSESSFLFQENRPYVESTAFSFSSIPTGMYTLVIVYDRNIAPPQYRRIERWVPILEDPYLSIADYRQDNVYDHAVIETDSFRVVASFVLSGVVSTPSNLFAVGEENDYLVVVNTLASSTTLVVSVFTGGNLERCELSPLALLQNINLEITYDDRRKRLEVSKDGVQECFGRAKRGTSGLLSNLKIWTSAPGIRRSAADLSFIQIYSPIITGTRFYTLVSPIYIAANLTFTINVLRQVKRGEAKLSLIYRALDNLDLSIRFAAVDDEGNSRICTVGSRMLSDGICKCGGAYVTRNDKTFLNNRKIDIVTISDFVPTVYHVFASRTSANPESDGANPWRSDGRCGKRFPLIDGGTSRCPIEPFTWPDGSVEARPCCNSKGFCGSTIQDCECRYCVNYQSFATSDWEDSYRQDGICRSTDERAPNGNVANCPISPVLWVDEIDVRPCCTDYGRCGIVTNANCLCENCLDYRIFGNETLNNTNGLVEGILQPTEDSVATFQLYTSTGRMAVFLPQHYDSSAYEDGHVFTGLRTDSSTYVRVFCIDTSSTNAAVHEYAQPHYFKFQERMLRMTSGSCPGGGTCEYLTLNGFSIPEPSATDILNAKYIKRFEISRRFSSLIGYEADASCRMLSYAYYFLGIEVLRQGEIDLSVNNLKLCFETCQESNECGVIFIILRNSRGYK